MLSLKKIAVTGGLASGKSTVCQMLKELGAYVVSADLIVHELLSPDSTVGKQVIQQFGSDLVTDGRINRKKLADIVFSNPDQLRALEKILHPAVFEEIKKKYREVNDQNQYALFVAEIPLLYEAHAEQDYDAVLTVSAPLEQCEKRFIEKDNHTEKEFKLRMGSQINPQEKVKKAHYVIENNSTISELKNQVIKIYSLLTST
ncbi:MAG: dephospho-CoA kinase [Rhabdochlamydiaceae bacterium]|nr:dephospho-CoA kinase [Rhabdochlamydiaceae bacterium]